MLRTDEESTSGRLICLSVTGKITATYITRKKGSKMGSDLKRKWLKQGGVRRKDGW